MTEETALNTPVREYKHLKSGKKLREACEKAGISIYIYKKRLANGMSEEEALSTPKRDTIRSICERYGITTSTYYKRAKKGIYPPYDT